MTQAQQFNMGHMIQPRPFGGSSVIPKLMLDMAYLYKIWWV